MLRPALVLLFAAGCSAATINVGWELQTDQGITFSAFDYDFWSDVQEQFPGPSLVSDCGADPCFLPPGYPTADADYNTVLDLFDQGTGPAPEPGTRMLILAGLGTWVIFLGPANGLWRANKCLTCRFAPNDKSFISRRMESLP